MKKICIALILFVFMLPSSLVYGHTDIDCDNVISSEKKMELIGISNEISIGEVRKVDDIEIFKKEKDEVGISKELNEIINGLEIGDTAEYKGTEIFIGEPLDDTNLNIQNDSNTIMPFAAIPSTCYCGGSVRDVMQNTVEFGHYIGGILYYDVYGRYQAQCNLCTQKYGVGYSVYLYTYRRGQSV